MKAIRKGQIALIELSDNMKVNAVVYNLEDNRIYLGLDENGYDNVQHLALNDEILVSIFTPYGIKVMHSKVVNPPSEGDFIIEFDQNHQVVERRQFIRSHTKVKVLVKINDEYKSATTRDLGGGGLRFESELELKVGEVIDARIILETHKPDIKIKGIIIKRVDEAFNVYILQYTKIETEDRERIINYCLSLNKQEYGD